MTDEGTGHKEWIAKIEKECSGVWAQSGVTQWERDRMTEWKDRTFLTDKQQKILDDIIEKVFGEKEDDEDDEGDPYGDKFTGRGPHQQD